MIRKLLSCAVLIACSTTANAGIVLEEGFDDVNGLTDWLVGNVGSASGLPVNPWFQGNTGIFDSQSGAADSYIASNYTTTEIGGNVENWLVTPLLSVFGGATISFSTRTSGALPGDNLEVLFNDVGDGQNLADFVSLGVITSAGYPTDWQWFNFAYDGSSSNARFAFRYTVTDTSANGDYIGIDSVSVSVPEPGTMLLMGAGLLLMPLAMRRRRRDQI
jgi:hypothetical protein